MCNACLIVEGCARKRDGNTVDKSGKQEVVKDEQRREDVVAKRSEWIFSVFFNLVDEEPDNKYDGNDGKW